MKRLWTRRTVTAPPTVERPELSNLLLGEQFELIQSGYIHCRGCGSINSRSDDDDHGQPASCTAVGAPKVSANQRRVAG